MDAQSVFARRPGGVVRSARAWRRVDEPGRSSPPAPALQQRDSWAACAVDSRVPGWLVLSASRKANLLERTPQYVHVLSGIGECPLRRAALCPHWEPACQKAGESTAF